MKAYQKKEKNNIVTQQKKSKQSSFMEDMRPEMVAQTKLYDMVNNSERVTQLQSLQRMADNQVQNNTFVPIQRKENNTGLPDNLKSGIENLSGHAMDDVKVHYNSPKPAQLQAHAYAQGTDIHLASGQEKHLPHEAWHVVQQKQGRVKPTMQMKGKVNVNDDSGLEREADVMGAKALSTGVSYQMKKNVSLKTQHDAPVQRLSVNENPINLTTVNSVTRSGAGADGVYFFRDAENTVVIKPDFESNAAEIMHRFMGTVGVGVPVLRAVSFSSREGRSITQKLREYRGTLAEDKQEALDNNIQAEKPYSIMEFVTGEDFTQMDYTALGQMISDDDILRDLGKIMAVDFFSGNGDRFYQKVNMGNFMIKEGRLFAVDNTTRFDLAAHGENLRRNGSTQREHGREENIKTILNPIERVGYINQFLTKVKQDMDRKEGGTTGSAAINDDNVKTKMGEGIDTALAELQIAMHTKTFTDSLDLSNLKETGGRDVRKADAKSGLSATTRFLDVAKMAEKKDGRITGNAHLREHDPATGNIKKIGRKLARGTIIKYDSTATVRAKNDDWYKAYDETNKTYGLIRVNKIQAN